MNLGNILESIINIVLPRSKRVLDIENIDMETFRSKTAISTTRLNSLPNDTFSVLDYKTPLARDSIWEMKYRGNKKIIKLLASVFYEEIVEQLHERKLSENFEKPLLIPIPISKQRMAERGWNQCELISNALEEIDKDNFFKVNNDVLIKIRDIKSQTSKNREKRLKDIAGCFSVKGCEAIAGKNVIIIDDVLTTGATMREAKKTLLDAGAKKIICACLAH